MSSKKIITNIQNKTELILKNQKNSNFILDLFKYSNSSNKSVKSKALKSLTLLFESFLNKELIQHDSKMKLLNDQKQRKFDAVDKYNNWLFERYTDFKKLLISCISNTDKSNSDYIKIVSMNLIFDLIKCETKQNFKKNDESRNQSENLNNNVFPFDLFHSTLEAVLKSNSNDKLLKRLGFFLGFSDIRYFYLKYILNDLFQKSTIDEIKFENLLNIFCLLRNLTKKTSNKVKIQEDLLDENQKYPLNDYEKSIILDHIEIKEDYCNLFSIKKENLSPKSKICNKDAHRKLFNDCIVSLLKIELNVNLYKKLLIKLPEKILPKMSNPLMLADFLTQSYNFGGLISVLSLNSLFILINDYNLEYPNFFIKVYQILDPSILNSKFKDRFFQLLDSFLLSTHLSASLVAAFIKKLSRISLTCPPGDLKFLSLLIFNLMIRHKNCKILVQRNNKNKINNENFDDPFQVDIKEYNMCNAFKSSLWEIQSLKSHYLCHIAKEIDKINNLNNETEFTLDEAFENNSYEDLINQELDSSKCTANCAVNFFLEKNENFYRFVNSNISKLIKFN